MIGKKVSLKAVRTKWVQYYKIGSKTLNPSMSFGLYYHPNMSCELYYNPNSSYLEPQKIKEFADFGIRCYSISMILISTRNPSLWDL